MVRITSLLLVIFIFTAFQTGNKKVSVQMETQKVMQGKKLSVKATIYFKVDKGEMITHFVYPEEYILFSNPYGEIKLYYPDKNEVMSLQNSMFTSQGETLYQFMTNNIEDMGLKDLGFSLNSTRYENNSLVTIWVPSKPEIKEISKVELVHENQVPIYMAIYNDKDVINKKTYYKNYFVDPRGIIPQKIIEIEYLPSGDSVVSRQNYSDIKFGEAANSMYFDYKIPDDAKLISTPSFLK